MFNRIGGIIESVEAFNLALLGLFIPVVNNSMENQIVRCTFCKRSFPYGPRSAEIDPHSKDARVATLLRRHSVCCSNCPRSIRINGDNNQRYMIELLINLNENYLNQKQLRNLPFQTFYFTHSPTSYSLCSDSCEMNDEPEQDWELQTEVENTLSVINYLITCT